MEWTEQQRLELAHELARIGYRTGDLWPTPAVDFTPDEMLALYRRVPDGAGREGYIAEMAKTVRQVMEG